MTIEQSVKLSVCLLVYNHEKYLAQTLDHVLAQITPFSFEIVVGEDLSTDGTMRVLNDYVRRHGSQIRVLPTSSKLGPMHNLLRTFAACRGKYIALLEGDDYWTATDKLARQVEFLDKHPRHMICAHRVCRIREEGTWIDVYPRTTRRNLTLRDLLVWNFLFTCSVVLRRIPGNDIPSWISDCAVGDWPMFLVHAQHGGIHVFPEVMGAYRQHGGGMWSQQTPRVSCSKLIPTLEVIGKHLECRYSGLVRDAIAWHQFMVACFAAGEGDWRESLRIMANSFGEADTIARLLGIGRIGITRLAEEFAWMQYGRAAKQ